MDNKCSTPQRLVEKIDKALQHVFDIAAGRQRWTMRVPALPGEDSDCVLADALKEARDYIQSESGERTAAQQVNRAETDPGAKNSADTYREPAAAAALTPSATVSASQMSPNLRESLLGTASMLREFSKLAKEPASQGYTRPRTIEVAVWDHCDAGGESVDAFELEDGEAEVVADLIAAAIARVDSYANSKENK